MSGEEQSSPIVVSACLMGRRCRFDGRDKLDPQLAARLAGRPTIVVCPEELGGLGTPRPACQLSGGDGGEVVDGAAQVIDSDGRDRSDAFIAGAHAALAEAIAAGSKIAILKDRSPSCGTRGVWRDGAIAPGRGVFAAMLARHGISAVSEADAEKLLSGADRRDD